MVDLVAALGPAFAAGFAVQQFLEIISPVVERLKWDKKLTLGIVSLVIGLVLSFGAGLRVLEPLGVKNAGIWDNVVTGLIISAGTEGFNSIMKFLGYTKEKQKADAAKETGSAPPAALARMK